MRTFGTDGRLDWWSVGLACLAERLAQALAGESNARVRDSKFATRAWVRDNSANK